MKKSYYKIPDINKQCQIEQEKIATYVTHLLDENMIASKYGQENLNMIVEVMKDEQD